MLTWLRVHAAAKRLNIIDKGPLISDIPNYTRRSRIISHVVCGTPARLGLRKDSRDIVYWCHRCENVTDIGKSDDGDWGGKGKRIPPTPPVPEEPISPSARDKAHKILEKMKRG